MYLSPYAAARRASQNHQGMDARASQTHKPSPTKWMDLFYMH